MIKNYGDFFPKYEKPKQEYSRYRDQYKVVYAENGNKEFIHIGQIDMYARTQSHKDSVLIENIIKRATNDPSVLQRRKGSFADITEVPNNMADAMKVVNDAKKVYEALPKAVKDSYNNSFDNFLGTFRTATGLAKFVSMTTQNKASVQNVNKESEDSVNA